MKPRVDKACNGTVRASVGQAGMRAELKVLLAVVAAVGVALLGALVRGWMGG
jgi:hypothetical protein